MKQNDNKKDPMVQSIINQVNSVQHLQPASIASGEKELHLLPYLGPLSSLGFACPVRLRFKSLIAAEPVAYGCAVTWADKNKTSFRNLRSLNDKAIGVLVKPANDPLLPAYCIAGQPARIAYKGAVLALFDRSSQHNSDLAARVVSTHNMPVLGALCGLGVAGETVPLAARVSGDVQATRSGAITLNCEAL